CARMGGYGSTYFDYW
nr:immunoglobulin heavy chain junction region [Mus musculus]